MDFITISRRQYIEGVIESYSSQDNDINGVQNILKEGGFWCSARRSSPAIEHFVIDYHRPVAFDFIELFPSPQSRSAFPKAFRFECSDDKMTWTILHAERNFILESDVFLMELPLLQARYLKVIVLESNAEAFYTEIGRCRIGISGVADITASSSHSSGTGAEHLLSESMDSLWESSRRKESTDEHVTADLGRVFHINRIILGSAESGFPEQFHVETSTDGNIWTHLFEEKDFRAQPLTNYSWNVDLTPARFVRIEARGAALPDKTFGVKLSCLDISAAPYDRLHTHNIGQLNPYASIFQAGIVRLSKDGENNTGMAVQASDSRLRDSSTLFKGIVRLAENGETDSGIAVQASDSRLMQASELSYGIVRLGYDRESKPGIVVQGNDSRLQEATEKSFGIVRLCPDGQYNERSVVQGNDSRIGKATTESHGICKLAPNGKAVAGAVVQADDRRLNDASTISTGIVELAEDGEDAAGVAVQGNDRRLKESTTRTKGIMELAEDGEDAAGVAVQGNDRRLKEATVKTKGIVELAEDGEDKQGVAVQGNDRRLKDATEQARGIAQFASDGEAAELKAVQGNDKRLRNATTMFKGIVEFAEDGEDADGVAVQGNDRRLKDASTKAKGIVELAEDGEDAPGVAVQGSDRRLKEATEHSTGTAQFASDGEAASLKAVQGNDRRLRDATSLNKGIVELAEDGENAAGVAVQGNDRRLKDASTKAKGIVELAEDGEDAAGVAVQGNDRRLKNATEERHGIVKMAKHGEKKGGHAVQSDDRRLYNAREPLPHAHEYAPLNHEFDSHLGTISVKGNKHETFNEITPPSDRSTAIHGLNDSNESGSIGVAGIAGLLGKEKHTYGVVGHSRHIGVRGQSSGNEKLKGCGVMGLSRFGAGGVFASEHGYSLVVDGFGTLAPYDETVHFIGNGDALSVKGKSEFDGSLRIRNEKKESEEQYPANIVEFFEVDEQEYIAPGDLLVASVSGKGILSRSRTEYNRAVVGIVSGNPTVIINNAGREDRVYPVVLAGRAWCRVDARNKPVKPGDLIVTSGSPGCGMAGTIDAFERIGCVIGKALDGLDEGTGLIPVYIAHM